MRMQLAELRAKMKELEIDVYIVSDKDEHLNEYTGAHFCALEEFSGFTGGDGTLVVTADRAALWTDGRYFTQAEGELEGSGIELMRMGEKGTPAVPSWIAGEMPASGTLGFDGRCTSYSDGYRYIHALKAGCRARTDQDVCGLVWKDRPAEEVTPCWRLEERYCGKRAEEKLAELRAAMKRLGAASHVIASPDDIAWLLNLRASDIPCNPVFMAYLIVTAESAVLYTDAAHFTDGTAYLQKLGVGLRPQEAVFEDIGSAESPVLIDRKRCSYALANSIKAGSRIIDRMNPTMAAKCLKNETERDSIRIAQQRDSLAVTRFMYWFGKTVRGEAGDFVLMENDRYRIVSCEAPDAKAAPGPKRLTEWDCAVMLYELRTAGEHFLSESFHTISAYGANAAMAHYMPSPDREVVIAPRGLYLVDSGGQYLEGTTDVTRTWRCGEITEEERAAFTLTVIANLRLADARFPEGVSGLVLDYAAREPFWRRGMNYNHGTGHGVGHVLNVHESPAGIRYRASALDGSYAVQEGMYISDEPGYYEPGKFGVRTENMLLAVPDHENAYGRFLRFEICTLVPIDTGCLDVALMSVDDRRLLNEYHAAVYAALADRMCGDAERAWLAEACAKI